MELNDLIRWAAQAAMGSEREARLEAKRRTIRREGKTARDHASGSHGGHLDNKLERSEYYRDSKNNSFPWHTCNGKRNRQRWTGRNHQEIIRPLRFVGGR